MLIGFEAFFPRKIRSRSDDARYANRRLHAGWLATCLSVCLSRSGAKHIDDSARGRDEIHKVNMYGQSALSDHGLWMRVASGVDGRPWGVRQGAKEWKSSSIVPAFLFHPERSQYADRHPREPGKGSSVWKQGRIVLCSGWGDYGWKRGCDRLVSWIACFAGDGTSRSMTSAFWSGMLVRERIGDSFRYWFSSFIRSC